MAEKHYIHEFNDNLFKKLFEEYACIDCGLIPYHDVEKTELEEANIIEYGKWIRYPEGVYCPNCIRKKKIKEIQKKLKN